MKRYEVMYLIRPTLDSEAVKKMLDAVIDYLPAPTDIDAIIGHDEYGNEIIRHASDTDPFTALAFKVMTDPFVGKLTFFRVYSGVAVAGSYVKNTTKDEKERFGRILQMHANSREEIKEVYAGDIAAAVGLKETTTGDTLAGGIDWRRLDRLVTIKLRLVVAKAEAISAGFSMFTYGVTFGLMKHIGGFDKVFDKSSKFLTRLAEAMKISVNSGVITAATTVLFTGPQAAVETMIGLINNNNQRSRESRMIDQTLMKVKGLV